jgi:general stress protein 26
MVDTDDPIGQVARLVDKARLCMLTTMTADGQHVARPMALQEVETARLVHDRAKAEELWSAPLKVWFPDGLETPGLALLKVQAVSAEYWDSPSSMVVKLLGAARAAITGDPDKFPGSNETVQL